VGQYNATGGYWWPEYVRLGGRVVAFNSQGTNNTVFLHKDLANSTHMVTGPSGSVIQDQIFYPWGQSKSSLGTWYNQEFAAEPGDRRNVVQVYFVSFYTSRRSIPSFFVRRR
jgi:hypothetical protein